ncbi:MAG: hypothetical protein M1819_006827 [Sarea resinae]|nr:MAG: hypothetical protein M1819_006827 [Sarea resinae]
MLLAIDDLLRLRAGETAQPHILACPKGEKSLTEYEYFTARDVDRFAGAAAHTLRTRGLEEVQEERPLVAAVLGPSNLEYLMTICGLSRLGYTVLVFSPRLSAPAYEALLDETKCAILVHDKHYSDIAAQINGSQNTSPLRKIALLSRTEFDLDEPVEWRPAHVKTESTLARVAFIMHSSGSTGLPKPIYHTHQRCLRTFRDGFPFSSLITLPLYHSYGFSCFWRAMHDRSLIYLFGSNMPLTVSNASGILQVAKPEMVSTVPYLLKLFAESENGIAVLKECKLVTYHGSTCPDELGDRLVKEGVNLVAHLGSTEAGPLASSSRPPGDTTWNYYRFLPSVQPHVWMKDVGANNYELVLLQGLKTKVLSNSDSPPGSLHTRDIFTPHPSIKDAWKFIGRLDDRVTLLNGEKVLPLPIEGHIRQDPLVKEAVVFGVGKSGPGLLVFRSPLAASLSDTEFRAKIWPVVEEANALAETFSYISQEMILIFPDTIDYPRTDKGSIIRGRVYQMFAKEIDDLYRRLEESHGGTRVLDVPGIEQYLLDLCSTRINIQLDSRDSDLFQSGLDSLRGIELASHIKSDLDLGGKEGAVNQNVIYEKGTIRALAPYLYSLRTGSSLSGKGHIQQMEELVSEYSNFRARVHDTASQEKSDHVVVLTGATGSLGAHLLSQLIKTPSVKKVYCLIRHQTTLDSTSRIRDSMHGRGLDIPPVYYQKIEALGCNLSQPDLGLELGTFEAIKDSVTHILHCAWEVNFNLSLETFEQDHIKGLWNLINLSLSVSSSSPARLYFCSSISVALRSPTEKAVPEALINDFDAAVSTGYGRSKLVAEHIIQNAREHGALCYVLRIGQIVGDSYTSPWNSSEAIPLMIRSALVLKALPSFSQTCSWFPVDLLAKAIIEIAGVATPPSTLPHPATSISSSSSTSPTPTPMPMVYNLVNPSTFAWDTDVLPALHAAGLSFDAVSGHAWVSLLRASADQDARSNPTIKLLAFYETRYGHLRGVGGVGGPGEDSQIPYLRFDTSNAERASLTMRSLPNLVQEGYIGRFLDQWMREWKGEGN